MYTISLLIEFKNLGNSSEIGHKCKMAINLFAYIDIFDKVILK